MVRNELEFGAPGSAWTPVTEGSRRRRTPASRSPSPAAPRRSKANAAPPAAASERLRRHQTVAFACLFGGYFLYTVGRRGVTVSAAAMGEELGFTMEDIGMLNSAFTSAYGGSKFLGNVLCDFFSSSQLFVLGLTAVGVTNIAMGLSEARGLSIAVWFANGSLQGLGWPALSEIVMKWYPPAVRGSIWSSCTVAGNLAKTVSPVTLAFLASNLGWRWALYGPGGAALVGAGLLLVFLYLRASGHQPTSCRHYDW